MLRISLAFRAFFNILFHGGLSDATLASLGLSRRPTSQAPAAPVFKPSDGALQILAILQRDSRLIDFIMEDISGADDDQIGAAVREVHDKCRDSLTRYVPMQPVIDGVEGTFTKPASTDASVVKFVGNVPAGTPTGGILRHKGWRAVKTDLPGLNPRQDTAVIAPAEIEIE